MKITWFGGTTVRVHIGGQIVVVDARRAPQGIDAAELVSGADVVVGLGEAVPADASGWRPRKPSRLIDEVDGPYAVACWTLGQGAILVETVGESPLLMLSGELVRPGRWGGEAVVVLLGTGIAKRGTALLEAFAPRLLVLAGDEAEVDAAFATLGPLLDGTGMMALEHAMALEV